MIDFLIFYEVKNREMESIVLLGNELKKRGFTCEFISFSQIYSITMKKRYFGKVRVAVVPSLYHDKEILHIVYRIAGKVDYIVNLRWEQVFSNETESDVKNYVFPKENAVKAIHCCWGKKPKEMLIRAGVNDKNAVVTGPMHMDILAPSFEKYFLSKDKLFDKFNIPQNRKTILFISSFVLAAYTEREIEWYLGDVGGDKRKELIEQLKFDKTSQQTIISWLLHVAEKYDYNIVYRPHPAENPLYANEISKNNANFYVISELNVKQWIKKCDVVLTWVSTSIIESFFAGVSCAVLRPLEIPYEREMSVYKGIHTIKNREELEKYFDYLKAYNNNMFLLDEEIVLNYYDHSDKKLSYVRTADLLCDLSAGYEKFDWNEMHIRPFMQEIKWDAELIKKSLYKMFLKVLSVPMIRKKIQVKFLKDRIDSFLAFEKKNKTNIISKSEFKAMERKLSKYIR